MKIEIRLIPRQFEYDIYHLIQAFYPGAEIRVFCGTEASPDGWFPDLVFTVRVESDRVSFVIGDRTGTVRDDVPAGETKLIAPENRLKTKNQLKKLVYSSLAAKTGRELPWGDLCGIRPVKLATGFLREGMAEAEAAVRMRRDYCVSAEKAALACEIAKREEDILSGVPCRDGYSLYVDIPFCPSICLYCTFGSHPIDRFSGFVEPYLAALKKELSAVRRMAEGKKLICVYMGGGTPTSVSPEQMDSLLAFLEETFPMDSALEFTVEAGRPDTISRDMLKVLSEHSVSRISINPQTMNQKTLDVIGRRHTADDVRRAFDEAREAGFSNINMDMIVGLPGEGVEEVGQTLCEIGKLRPDGLTVHSLALKRAARLNLFRDEYADISFRNSPEIMEMAADAAKRMDMNPYYLYRQKNMAGNFENVGYARPGCECLYNIMIMEERQTILGAGCGAASKFILDDGRVERAADVKDLREYLSRTDEMIERKRKKAEETGLFPALHE